MIERPTQDTAEHYRLREAVSLRLSVAEESIWLYEDVSDFLAEILKGCYSVHCRLITVCPVRPEIAMAADRAETEVIESAAENPFAVDIDAVLERVHSKSDIIFIANPNRVTGATYSLSQLKELAGAVPEGLLIVDEYYHDFFRVTAFPITRQFDNVVVLHPFENWTTPNFLDCGFAVLNAGLAGRLKNELCRCSMSRTTAKCCWTRFKDENTRTEKISNIQEQSLHLAAALTALNLNCQISPADFLLIEVGDPGSVSEFLDHYNIRVERIHNHDRLTNFLRYRIAGSPADSGLIDAFKKMPRNYLNIGERSDRWSIDFEDEVITAGETAGPTTKEIDAID